MVTIAHLRPHYSQDGAGRLLADVEQAVAAGSELGDRRPILCELTDDLHRNFERLQQAIIDLQAMQRVGFGRDAESEMIDAGKAACADLISRLDPLLHKADHLNALMKIAPSQDAADTTPNASSAET